MKDPKIRIVDVSLPNLNGISAIKRILEVSLESKIVMMSAMSAR